MWCDVKLSPTDSKQAYSRGPLKTVLVILQLFPSRERTKVLILSYFYL